MEEGSSWKEPVKLSPRAKKTQGKDESPGQGQANLFQQIGKLLDGHWSA